MQVRDKMMYAATKATVRKAFQSGIIVDDVAATSKVLSYVQCSSVIRLSFTKYVKGGKS